MDLHNRWFFNEYCCPPLFLSDRINADLRYKCRFDFRDGPVVNRIIIFFLFQKEAYSYYRLRLYFRKCRSEHDRPLWKWETAGDQYWRLRSISFDPHPSLWFYYH